MDVNFMYCDRPQDGIDSHRRETFLFGIGKGLAPQHWICRSPQGFLCNLLVLGVLLTGLELPLEMARLP